jgi:hypothetical protein
MPSSERQIGEKSKDGFVSDAAHHQCPLPGDLNN